MKTLIYGIGVVFLAVVLVAVIGLVAALPVMLLWNAVVPDVFSLPAITYWQAYALYFLCYLLFSHTSSSSKEN